jgi:hypothetical protein
LSPLPEQVLSPEPELLRAWGPAQEQVRQPQEQRQQEQQPQEQRPQEQPEPEQLHHHRMRYTQSQSLKELLVRRRPKGP